MACYEISTSVIVSAAVLVRSQNIAKNWKPAFCFRFGIYLTRCEEEDDFLDRVDNVRTENNWGSAPLVEGFVTETELEEKERGRQEEWGSRQFGSEIRASFDLSFPN